jgi:hypothetical protein
VLRESTFKEYISNNINYNNLLSLSNLNKGKGKSVSFNVLKQVLGKVLILKK